MSQDITLESLTQEALIEFRSKKHKSIRKKRIKKIRADVFDALMAKHDWVKLPTFSLLPEAQLLMKAVDAAGEIYMQELQNKQD